MKNYSLNSLENINIKKTLIWSAIGVGVAVGGIFAIKSFIKLIKQRDGKSELREGEKEIVKSEMSFSKATYESMANSLYIAMKGLNTDIPTLKRVIDSMKTKTDYLMTAKAFGIKKADGWFGYNFEGNLSQWIVDEMYDEVAYTKDPIFDKLNSIGIVL